MILADTSVWIEHFRRGLPRFEQELHHNRVLIHPVVIGELATGNLSHRKSTLAFLHRLPAAKPAASEEGLVFLESHRLFGQGIGWNDVQLLASTRLSNAMLWTVDKRLAEASRRLGVDFSHAC